MVEIGEENVAFVDEIGRVSIAFRVERIFDVRREEAGKLKLSEREAKSPYLKDYDTVDGTRPGQWREKFDLSNWGLFMARDGAQLIGTVAIAFDTLNVYMLEGRRDLAVIWDIRVVPERRGHGIGTQLMRAAQGWAETRRCRELKVETQDINVDACRFYEKNGFRLLEANAAAYPDHPDETQLIWMKALDGAGR